MASQMGVVTEMVVVFECTGAVPQMAIAPGRDCTDYAGSSNLC